MSVSTLEKTRIFQSQKSVEEALSHSKRISLAVIGTGKPIKISALQEMIHQAGHGGELAQMDTLTEELQHDHAPVVALQKAIDSRNHAIAKNPEYADETVAVAGDATFSVWSKNARWESVHKLDRLGRFLKEEEIAKTYDKVKGILSQPKVLVKWNIAAATANGKLATVHEDLVVKTSAIPDELIEQYFFSAVDSGLLYSSNGLHVALLELLQESGKIQEVGIVPGQPWQSWSKTSDEETPSLKYWMQEYKDWGSDYRQLAIRSVISTTPHAVLQL